MSDDAPLAEIIELAKNHAGKSTITPAPTAIQKPGNSSGWIRPPTRSTIAAVNASTPTRSPRPIRAATVSSRLRRVAKISMG